MRPGEGQEGGGIGDSPPPPLSPPRAPPPMKVGVCIRWRGKDGPDKEESQ